MPRARTASKKTGTKRPRSKAKAKTKTDAVTVNGSGPRSKRRRKQGNKAKMEMNQERRRAHLKLALPKARVRRLIRRTIEELVSEPDNGVQNVSVHVQDSAKLLLQYGAEQYGVNLIEQADRLRKFCKKVRLTKNHLKFFNDNLEQSPHSIGGVVPNCPKRLGDGSFQDTPPLDQKDDAFEPDQ